MFSYALVGLIAAVLTAILNRTPPAPQTWSTGGVSLSDHVYQNGSQDLVNLTTLFAWRHDDPIIQNFLHSASNRNAYSSLQVIPFYRAAEKSIDPGTITMITWVTVDRLDRLIKLAEAGYRVSVAYYIPPDEAQAYTSLKTLEDSMLEHPALKANIDFHLISAPTYKLRSNSYRNIARMFVKTDWILLWDVDLEPCTNIQKTLDDRLLKSEYAEAFRSAKAVALITAFEWTSIAENTGPLCPKDKRTLKELFESMDIDTFEPFNPIQSHATNYARFLNTTEIYPVEEYELGYEGYPIFHKSLPMWADDRFVGYGWNRGAFTAQLYLAGIDLLVVPGEYAVHMEHEPSIRKLGIPQVQLAWHTFRMDLCHMLGTTLSDQGKLHLEEGLRLREACSDTTQDEVFLIVWQDLLEKSEAV